MTRALRTRVATLLCGAVAGGCTHSEAENAGNPATATPTARDARGGVRTAKLTVLDGTLRRATWVMRDRLFGLSPDRSATRLGAAVNAPFTGTLAPAVVSSPNNERLVAYNAFLRNRPVLRVHDLEQGTDAVVDEGTFSLAWSRDGALAYFKGLNARVRDPVRHLGHVVVRRHLRASAARWTTAPGSYVVTAWAGPRLVVHERRGIAWPNVVLFEGPGRKRVLAERAALVALSPDGSRAFITKQPDPSPAVAVVDIASGEEVARYGFSGQAEPIRRQPIGYVADSGAWASDTVVAAVSGGVAVFRVGEDIVLEELLGLDPETFPVGLTEPKTDDAGRYFYAVAQLEQRPRAAFARAAVIECDRVARRCVLSRASAAFLPPRLVYNPSRPLAPG